MPIDPNGAVRSQESTQGNSMRPIDNSDLRSGALIISHRGACRAAPENTVAAGRKAAALGADIVELDVRESSDGILYVLHDATLERTTNGCGPIADTPSCDLDRLDAGSWFGPEFAGEPLPRLDIFLKALKPIIGFYVEVKVAEPGKVAACLESAGLGSGCIIYSEDPDLRSALRRELPQQLHMENFRNHSGMEEAKATGASVLEFMSDDLTSSRVLRARSLGFLTMMHTPLLDRDAFRLALVEGVDYLNIDYPEEASGMRQELLSRWRESRL